MRELVEGLLVLSVVVNIILGFGVAAERSHVRICNAESELNERLAQVQIDDMQTLLNTEINEEKYYRNEAAVQGCLHVVYGLRKRIPKDVARKAIDYCHSFHAQVGEDE